MFSRYLALYLTPLLSLPAILSSPRLIKLYTNPSDSRSLSHTRSIQVCCYCENVYDFVEAPRKITHRTFIYSHNFSIVQKCRIFLLNSFLLLLLCFCFQKYFEFCSLFLEISRKVCVGFFVVVVHSVSFLFFLLPDSLESSFSCLVVRACVCFALYVYIESYTLFVV